jgi:small-conductance mechanosensitive channel
VAGINVLPVLATSTVVTVVVGLALQDTLGNLISGLALHAEKPFELGDWILVDGIEGQVVYMGWRATRLRTFSSDMVALPNSVIARARLQNFYAPDKLCSRIVEQPVLLSAAPEAVEAAIGRAAARVARVRADPAPRVRLVQVTPLFQRYAVRFWIDDFQQHDDIESDFMKAMWHECREQGVALPGVNPSAAALDPRDGATAPMPVG